MKPLTRYALETYSLGYSELIPRDHGQWYAKDEADAVIRELQAERDAARADAERYRWLRRNGKPAAEGLVMRQPEHWAAAIDAARSKE